MNVGSHQLPKRLVNQSVAFYAASPFKRVGNYRYVEMTAAVFGACMARMKMTLVFDKHLIR